MRTAEKLKRKMWYSLPGEPEPVYITRTDASGEEVKMETGEIRLTYSKPVEFKGNIAFSSGEAEAKEYGVTTADYDSVLIIPFRAYPLKETALIWWNEEPEYRDADHTEINPQSATFQIVADKSSQNVSRYLLKHLTK